MIFSFLGGLRKFCHVTYLNCSFVGAKLVYCLTESALYQSQRNIKRYRLINIDEIKA